MTFLAGAFFAGLAALAVPFLLHRMNQRLPAETAVASLMFLREVDEPARHRRALAHKALLALRLALLALVVCAFAQPMWSVAAGGEESSAAGRLIVVDGSFSMQRRSVWTDAMATARRLRDEASGPVRFALAADTLTVTDNLAELRAGWARLDFTTLPAALDAVAAALPEVADGWQAHVLSDFQASAVPERLNALVGREDLWRGARLHPVGEAVENVAVESVEVAGDRVHAVVANFAQRRRPLRVTLKPAADGVEGIATMESASVSVTVPAGARRQVEFSRPAPALQPTAWQVVVDDADDALPEDDARRFALPGTQGAAVGVLAPHGGPALRFLVTALAANAHNRPITLGDGAWPERLGAVVVLDPGALTAAMQRRLRRHLDRSGGLFLIAGPETERHGILPLVGTRLDANPFSSARRVLLNDASHPLAAISWDEVMVTRSLMSPAAAAETILSLVPSAQAVPSTQAVPSAQAVASAQAVRPAAGAQPLLIEKRVGAGRLLALLTALDRNWSDLVLRPAFVALVGGAVDYVTGEKPLLAVVGAPVAVGASAAQLFDHRGKRLSGLSQGATAAAKVVLRAPRPGVYTVRTPGAETLLAVNVDARESDPQPVSDRFLGRWQDALRPRTSPVARLDVEMKEGTALPLAGWLLSLALLCLLAESAVANSGWRMRPAAWPMVFR